MKFSVTCECGTKYNITKQEHLGRTLKCAQCQQVVHIPAAPEPTSANSVAEQDRSAPYGIETLSWRLPGTGDAAWNVPISVAWVILGLVIALKAPWLALLPSGLATFLNTVPLLISVAIFVWNLRSTILAIGHVGKAMVALPITFCQITLFALFFFQIACHWDAHAFTYDRSPGLFDWLGFTLVHALRAADLVDMFEAYGLELKHIDGDSWLASWALILFHVTIDVFALRLLMDLVSQRRAFIERHVELEGWKTLLYQFVGIFVVVWLASALFVRPWQWRDILLWPIDNFCRVIDVADLMQIFHIRFHKVPQFMWEGTLTFICRLILAVLVAKWLNYINEYLSLRFLGGFGLGPDELAEATREHPNSGTRERARIALKAALMTRASQFKWFSPAQLGYSCGVAIVLALLLLVVVPSGHADAVLAKHALEAEDELAERSFASLRKLGIRATGVIDELSAALLSGHLRSPAIVETLGYLGPLASEPLYEWAKDRPTEDKRLAIQSLGKIGPAAIPPLIQLHDKHDQSTRDAVRQAVLSIGLEGGTQFIGALTAENSGRVFSLLEEIDPYWYYAPSSNPEFERMKRLHEITEEILTWRGLGFHGSDDDLMSFFDMAQRTSFGEVCRDRLLENEEKFDDRTIEKLLGGGPNRFAPLLAPKSADYIREFRKRSRLKSLVRMLKTESDPEIRNHIKREIIGLRESR